MPWGHFHRFSMNAAIAAASLFVAASLAVGCETPSSKVDGGQLHGVFDRSKKRDAAPATTGSRRAKSATLRKTASPKHDAGAALPPAVRRSPPVGPCAKLATDPAAVEPLRGYSRPAGRPACRGARILEWRDPYGTPRYGCVYGPRDLERRKPLPMVLFFHGELDRPSAVHRKTRLRRHCRKLDLSGDPQRRGYLLLAPQGRRMKLADIRFDTDYLASDNVDLLTVDHFVDLLLREGVVDREQVYALGESAGGQMAALYAMMRPRLIAAYGTFGADASKLVWSCEGSGPPAAVLYRACDATTSCKQVERWLAARRANGAPTWSLRLGVGNKPEPHCTFSNRCSEKKGAANHYRWPKYREKELLEFLSRYTLKPPE